MIRKIISSGEEGVAKAALEAAVKLGVASGGWAIVTRAAAKQELTDRFGLKHLETGGLEEAERLNLLEADATLMLTRGDTHPRIKQVRRLCLSNDKPHLHIDLKTTGAFQAARDLAQWISGIDVQVLHVTGTDAASDPALARMVPDLLEAFFYLHLMPTGAVPDGQRPALLEEGPAPKSVPEALKRLAATLPLKDKTTIANMSEPELAALDSSLGEYIRTAFQLFTGNYALLESCRWIAKQSGIEPENAAAIIIRELWQELKTTHTLRIIK